MRINNPFGMSGKLDVDAHYEIGSLTSKFSLDKSGNATDTIYLKWKSFDSIEIFFEAEYQLLKLGSGISLVAGTGEGRFGFSARWSATFTDAGMELAQDGVQPRIWGTNKGEDDIVVAASVRLAESRPGAKKPFVEMGVALVAGYEDDGIQVGLGKGPASVGTSIGGSKGGSGSEMMIRFNIEAERPVIPVPKKPEPPKIKIRKETILVGSFEFGEARVAKIKPMAGMMDYSKLNSWYSSLPDRTRKKIEEEQKPPGDKMIVMTGFTDNVGDEHQNFELGRKRAIAVAEMFEKICGVPWKKIITAPSKGEQDNSQENKKLEKKEPKHRRVEVTIHVEE